MDDEDGTGGSFLGPPLGGAQLPGLDSQRNIDFCPGVERKRCFESLSGDGDNRVLVFTG